MLAAIPDPNYPTGDILFNFLSIIFEGAPYILIGTLLSGFIDAFLPAKLLDRILPRNKVVSTIMAGFLGLIFPVCECAVVPVVRRLVQKGLPLSCALTYLLSAPIINPIVILSTLTAFKELQPGPGAGDGMTLARISLGFVVAVGVGLFLMRRKPADILTPTVVSGMESAGGGHTPPQGFDAKLTHAMRTAMRDFLDTAMYFTIGVMITSVFNVKVDSADIEAVAAHEYISIPTMMGLAFLLALCSTSDAFIASPLEMPVTFAATAPKLAFLVFGPMLDVKLIFMYSAIFKRKFLIGFSIALFVIVGLLSKPWSMIFFKDPAEVTKPAVTAPAVPAKS